jgi:hypothetical protein
MAGFLRKLTCLLTGNSGKSQKPWCQAYCDREEVFLWLMKRSRILMFMLSNEIESSQKLYHEMKTTTADSGRI